MSGAKRRSRPTHESLASPRRGVRQSGGRERKVFKLKYFVFPMNERNIPEEFEEELLVSHRGEYIYHCKCGGTSLGNLKDLKFTDPRIYCGNNILYGACNVSIDMVKVSQRDDGLGKRVRKLMKLA